MPNGQWDGAERRQEPQGRAILSHIDKRFNDVETLIRSGFPNGDIEGHRRAHEEVIKSSEARDKLWAAVMEKLITGGVWAAFVVLIGALWTNFKDALR